jgi:hypothetical protein
MLFRMVTLKGIRDGDITVAFRRWKRPSVKTGGTLMTAVGQLEIASVTEVSSESITHEDAHQAGYETLVALLEELAGPEDREIYRVDLGMMGPDPRIALRQMLPDLEETTDLLKRLQSLDIRSADGPWTRQVLVTIEENPGVRSGTLCELLNQDQPKFKRRVRSLKNIGLTESLGTGYRLSPKGKALLVHLTAPDEEATS